MIYDIPTELAAINHLIAKEDHLLNQLSPEDFYDPDIRGVFVAMKNSYKKNKELNLMDVQDSLSDTRGAYWWIEMSNDAPYVGSPLQVVIRLRKYRARREAFSFKAKGKDEELPSEFIDKGREIDSFLRTNTDNREYIINSIKNPLKILPTGYGNFDYLSHGGLREGGMMVIAANAGTGKTTLAINIAKNVVSQGIPVHFVSLEMPEEDVVSRFMQCFWNETQENVRKNIDDMYEEKLSADFTVSNPNRDVDAVISSMSNNLQCGLFIVDYFGLMEIQSKESQFQKLEEISHKLQSFAFDNKKPMIVISQLNRDIEKSASNREPLSSDIRGTGALAQDAHIVSFLWDANAKTESDGVLPVFDGDLHGAPARAKTKERDLKWVIKKNRYGMNGSVDLEFDPKTMSFTEKHS